MRFFSRDEQKTSELMKDHVGEIKKTLDLFRKLAFAYIKGDDDYRELIHEVHDSEHRADEIRREVERCIYRGSFLPVVREDYIIVAELTDKIADQAQRCADIIVQEKPYVPPELRDDFRDLIREVVINFSPFAKLIRLENKSDHSRVTEYIDLIEAGEQRSDRAEWHLIADLYKLDDVSLAQKMHLRHLIVEIGSIADSVEDVSDRVLILLTKEIL